MRALNQPIVSPCGRAARNFIRSTRAARSPGRVPGNARRERGRLATGPPQPRPCAVVLRHFRNNAERMDPLPAMWGEAGVRGGWEGHGADPLEECDTVVSVLGRSFRLPTSRDLARIAVQAGERDAAPQLLNLCLVGGRRRRVWRYGPAKAWSEEELELIGSRLAQADPLAEILLDFQCPAARSRLRKRWIWPRFSGRSWKAARGAFA